MAFWVHGSRRFSTIARRSVMAPSSASRLSRKRPAADEPDRSVSPPPLKRKAQSNISKTAVASFFTPTSQKPKDRTTWTERAPDKDTPATLLVGRYDPENADDSERAKRRRIAAFDLDSTLITTKSGKKHAGDNADWKWWHDSIPLKLRELHNDEGYQIIIFTNQAGLTLHPDPKSKAPRGLKDRVSAFKQKCNAVLNLLDLPTTVYAATGRDIYRKPRTGMWAEMCKDHGLGDADVDLPGSVFVGDAGGRTAQLKGGDRGATAVAKDFSCSDRNFAHNVGIPYLTPEEYFLGEKARDFARDLDLVSYPFAEDGDTPVLFEKKNKKDIVIFCGPPGSGKSTFYWKALKPLGYERVNQDILKSKDKCFKAAAEMLAEGDSVVVDNTNVDADIRAQWVEFAKKHKVPIRCIWMKTALSLCEHNDAVRSLNKTMNPESRTGLPKLAFNGFAARFKEPSVKEGFQDIVEVEFQFRGSKEEYDIWGRYWL